jgi:hypothetical protein
MKCFCQSAAAVASGIASEHYEYSLWQESRLTHEKAVTDNVIHPLSSGLITSYELVETI